MKEGKEKEYITSVNVWIVYSMLQFETMIYFLALPLPLPLLPFVALTAVFVTSLV